MTAVITMTRATETIDIARFETAAAPALPARIPTDLAAPDFETRALEQAAVQLVLRMAEVIRIELEGAAQRSARRHEVPGNGYRPIDVKAEPSRRLAFPRAWLRRPSIRWPEVQHG